MLRFDDYLDGIVVGQTMYTKTVTSNNAGRIELKLGSSVQLAVTDILVVSLSSSKVRGTHGMLPYYPITTRRISEDAFLGDISFPEGWNEDYYVGKIIVDETESYKGYELSTYPLYFSHSSDS